MKVKLVFILFVSTLFFASCFTKEMSKPAPKTANPDIAVEYFQNKGQETAKTVHHSTFQPEEKNENKGDTEVDHTDKTLPAIKPVQNFKIVSGSFKSKQNAERFVNILKSLGYSESFYQYSDNGFYRVMVKVIPDERDAREYLQEFRRKDQKYNKAWLLYRKDEKR